MLAFDTAFTWEIAQLRRKLELDLRGLSSFVFWDSPTLLWIRRALEICMVLVVDMESPPSLPVLTI